MHVNIINVSCCESSGLVKGGRGQMAGCDCGGGGSRTERLRRVPGNISYTQFSVTRTAWHIGAQQTFSHDRGSFANMA